ncbi:hypothetical protein C0V70_16075 [Bacteriovorax stolpii]|uniref:Uncharacterized protein n=1 Tax=Bacteriovorax stolpii TaxID=960 RepID=A0A2K9NVR2_BACTC|nr:chalcone isomerase family protein [Bacteriovorax stolpii]AUN99596.1 hypothetical protein C0V70_16075 [Bacteriovorax stolpii]TDP51226.1 chalcone isomerase-like protein [Bacteriovorax stolpii]
MRSLVLGLVTLFSVSAHALTVDSIAFDDKVTVAGKELVLNGVGIRKATFLKIKVYYGALYLTAKTTNSGAFLGTNEPKQITMQFVRDVDAKDLKKTYKEAFEGANKETYKNMLPTFEAFNNNFTDIKKGERMVFTFLPDGVVLTLAGKSFPKAGDAAFSHAILNMWFINPLDEGLTKGLLGQ